VVLEPQFGRVELAGNYFRVASRTDLMGYIAQDGAFALEPQFDEAQPFREGRAAVRKGLYWSFLAPNLSPISDFAFRSVMPYSEGLAGVCVGTKWGFLDSLGAMVIDPQYEAVGAFSEGLAPAKLGGKWGYVNKAGAWVVPAVYAAAKPFGSGLAPVLVGSQWGYIRTNGQMAIPPRYQLAEPFVEGKAIVSTYGDFAGYIDPTGRKVLHEVFRPEGVRPFCQQFASVSRDGQTWVYAEPTGTRLTRWGDFLAAGPFSEGLACVFFSENSYSYLTPTGQVAFASAKLDTALRNRSLPELAEMMTYSGGLAPRAEGGAWGFQNRTGEWAIRPIFGRVGSFASGLAPAQGAATQVRVGYYTLTGQLIRPETR
jgi:hypothetical protein